MAAYEAQHVSGRNMVISADKQTAWLTALLDVSLTERPRFSGDLFFDIGQEFYSDLEMSGKGHEWPTQRVLQKMMTSGQLSLPVDDFINAWMLAQVLQKYTVGGVGPYTHTFKPATASRIPFFTSIYFEDTAAIKYRMHDLVGVELTVTIPENGPVTMQLSMVGSGKYTDGAIAAVPASPARTLLLGSDADFLMGASGAAASFKPRLRSMQYTITRDIEMHYGPGGALYALQPNVNSLRVKWSAMIRAKDTEAGAEPRSLNFANTLREVQMNVNSGAAAQLNLKIPNTYVVTKPVIDGKFVGWQLSGGDQDVVKVAGAELVEAVALNSTAAYLTAA